MFQSLPFKLIAPCMIIIVCACNRQELNGTLQPPSSSHQEADKSVADTPWHLLNFRAFSDRQLQTVKIIFTADDRDMLRRHLGLNGHIDPIEIEITKPDELRLAEFCVDGEYCLKEIVADGVRGGTSSGGVPVGEIRLQTKGETFIIGITLVGFALDSRDAHLNNTFYSTGLAELLKAIYFRQTNHDLPSPLIEQLSGKRYLQRIDDSFDRKWAKLSKP